LSTAGRGALGGATPLLEAAARNHVAAVQALVNGRADPNPSARGWGGGEGGGS